MENKYYDRSLERFNPEDLYKIRRSGFFLILSVLILLIPMGCWIIQSRLINEYIFLGAAIIAGIFQIAFLAGISGLAVNSKKKSLILFAVVFEIIVLSCMFVSVLFEEMNWYVMGTISPGSSLLLDRIEYIIWFVVIYGSSAGYGLTLGIYLMKNDERLLSGDLKFPGALWLTQGICQIAIVVIFLLRNYLFLYYFSFIEMIFFISSYLPVFVNLFGGLYLGVQLRRIPFKGEGDAWDRFKSRIQTSGQRPFGKVALFCSILGITISTIFYLFTSRFGWFWWAGLMGIILGIASIFIEGGHGFAIAAIIVGFFSWVLGPMLSVYSYYPYV